MKKAIFVLLLALLSAWMVTAAAENDPSTSDVAAQVPVDDTAQNDPVDADLPFDKNEGEMWAIDHSHHHDRHHKHHKHCKKHHKHCHKISRDGDYAMMVALFEKARVEYQAAMLQLAKALAVLHVINSANAAALADAIADIVTAQKLIDDASAKLNDAIAELARLKDVCKQSNAPLQAEIQQLRDALAICHSDDQSCYESLLKCEANKSDSNRRCLIELVATQATLAATQDQAQKCYTSLAACTISDTNATPI